jgi:hypothetical protein
MIIKEEKKKRRMEKRPMKAMSFRFDERIYNKFVEKVKENNLSIVEAIENLMNIAVHGILDFKKLRNTGIKKEEIVYEFAGKMDEERMVKKLKELIQTKKEFLPSSKKYNKFLGMGKPIIIRFPKFRVEYTPTELSIIENNKIKALITDEKELKEIENMLKTYIV